MRKVLWLALFSTGCWVSPQQVFDAQDRDGDGFNHLTDCNNEDPDVNPDAEEVCGDGIDNNCDGNTDDVGIGASTFYLDEDGDGWGIDSETTIACVEPPGYATQVGDCNDASADINPGLLDNSCDGIDNNCNTQIDEDAQVFQSYPDTDGDGFGDGNLAPVSGCSVPANYAANGNDCDDDNAQVHPQADEIDCDGVDNDCNPQTGDIPTRYFDNDEDGYGDPATAQDTCASDQWVDIAEDCDDEDDRRNPGLTEVACDNIDNDCDDTTLDGTIKYQDADGDGFGDPSVSQDTCEVDGWADNADDCNDANAAQHPNTLWFPDADSDGYGTGNAIQQCDDPGGHALADGDCDDSDARRSPGLPELCDFDVDNDCNASTLDEQVISIAGELEAFGTVQAAFDAIDPTAAQVEVDICPGTYLGGASTDFTGQLTVLGTNTANPPTLDGEGVTQVLGLVGAGAVLDLHDLVVTGGDATAAGACDRNGGGLCVLDATSLSLKDVTFANNEAISGAGLATNAGSTLVRVEMTGNVATTNGGGFHAVGATVQLTDCDITNNEATKGAGAWLENGELYVVDGTVSDNVASEAGGAVALSGSATLTGLVAQHNGGDYGATLWVSSQGARVSVSDVEFRGNRTQNQAGGAVYVVDSDLDISNSRLAGNAPMGGAVYATNSSVTMDDILFDGPLSTLGKGGGLYVVDSSATITNSTFAHTSASSGWGGSIYALDSTLTLDQTVFNWSASSYGGAIALVSSSAEVFGGTISNNRGGAGAGIAHISADSRLSITDGVLYNNTSSNSEYGGFYLEGDPSTATPAPAVLELVRAEFRSLAPDEVEVGHWTNDGSLGTDFPENTLITTTCTGDAGCSP